jgi:uncharacterized protein (TIGR02145 family)
MKNLCLLLLITGILSGKTFSQVSINTDGSQADPSAILDSKSTTKGVLIPRMTQAQILAIPNPANGLQVFCTTDNKIYIFISSDNQWKEIAYGTGSLMLPATYSIGTGGSCNNTTTHGQFYTGLPLSINDYVTILVSVSNIGTYSISSDTLNGYSFNANGSFSSTGSQTVNLMGTGTPVSALADNFTVTASNGGGTCTFSISVQFLAPCGSQIIDPRDGKSYNTVLIGSQCWMAQNLNTGTKINGSGDQSNNSIIEKYCYNDIESNCDVYGGLYQWNEMMQYVTEEGVKGICPAMWHIPTVGDWEVLETNLGEQYTAGGKMKSTGTLEEQTGLWLAPNTGATNSSGFTGLPGGWREWDTGYFMSLSKSNYMWSSTTHNGTQKWTRGLNYLNEELYQTYSSHYNYGFSVRCIKD